MGGTRTFNVILYHMGVRSTLLLMLSMALAGCSPGKTSRCMRLDVNGSSASDKSLKRPSQDAAAQFARDGLTFVVVRNSYGNTVTPLSKVIEPNDNLEIQSTDPNDLGTRLTKAAIEKSRGRFRLAPLQEDVRMRSPAGKWEINFINVERPCFHSGAVAYAREFNTKMLELALRRDR